MINNNLISIEKINLFLIKTVWEDNFSSTIKISELRKNCPCALCVSQPDKHIEGLALPELKIGEYNLCGIEPVGNYALQFTWGDKHDSGYYSLEYIRSLFEKYSLPEEEIDRLMKGATTPKLKKD